MNIFLINQILFTHADGVIPKVSTIKDTMIYQMCLGFKKLGHNITLAAAKEFKPTQEEKYDFEVIWFKSSKILPPHLLPFSNGLYTYLKTNAKNYDMVISKEVFSFSSLFAAKLCPEKTVLWVEQAQHQQKFYQIPSKLWFRLFRTIIKKVKIIVPCSHGAYVFLQKYFNNTTPDYVEHGINLEKFKSSVVKKRQLITSSQLISRKRIDKILKIYSEFHNITGFEDIRLLVAGRGPEESNLRTLAKKLGIASQVDFLGFLPQKVLNEYIGSSLAFLIRTEADLNMVSIPESIVSGTPVITNTVPLSSYYIKKEDLGLVDDNWNEETIVEVIHNNVKYVNNCTDFREKLSNVYSANKLIKLGS